MTAVGIIAEYNPFHLGHQYQLRALRYQLGEELGVVAVMSGNFVQRGDFALLPKHLRAEMALRCGVDLVLELPTVYAMAGAETFARGGVAILQAAGAVDYLAFGSECGDLPLLERVAACLDSEGYRTLLRRFLDEGTPYAAARQAAVQSLLGEAADCLSHPNNNLAVEYLRALRSLGAAMEPITVRRTGAAHDSGEDGEIVSASRIRSAVREGEDPGRWLPEPAAGCLRAAQALELAPASAACGERAVLAVLRRMEPEAFRPFDSGGEGLYRRLYQASREAVSLEDLLERIKTKRYPTARLRRMILAAYLNLECPPDRPPYLRVLGANSRGRELLRQMKQRASLPVLTKGADVRKLGPEAERFFRAEARCTDLYALACPNPPAPGAEYRTDPVIL